MSSSKIVEEMARDILALKHEVDRLSKLSPLYEIINPSANASLGADAANYAVGNYDLLYITPTTANRTISGLTNGVGGRLLYIFNGATHGTFSLLFTHQDALAIAANRITTTTAGTITLTSRKTALFVYDGVGVVTGSPRWIMLFPSA